MHIQNRIVGVLGLGQMLSWGSSYYLVATLGGVMATSVGLSPVAVYGMFSLALLVSALLGPFAGHMVDQHGGRRVLLLSNVMFALAHLTLAAAQRPWQMLVGWLILGLAMPFGLYDAAFATVVRIFKQQARRAIVGITLIAGFASSVSWPLTHAVELHWGWRSACLMWAAIHLLLAAPLHFWGLPKSEPVHAAVVPTSALDAAPAVPSPPVPPPLPATFWILAACFTAHGFVFAALAAHLPRLLTTAGAPLSVAVSAAALVGVFQVGGRVADAVLFRKAAPALAAKWASAMHPVAALLLWSIGAKAIYVFTALHGAGVGLMTIVKGTLPLSLFGASGFGKRAGLLEAPSKLAQAVAPIVFSLCLDAWGKQALWLTFALTALCFVGIMWVLRVRAHPA